MLRSIKSLLALLLLTTPLAFGDGLRTFFTSGVAADQGIPQASTAISFHKLTWTTQGTVSTCTVALDTSVDGVSWNAGAAIAGQTCTTPGTSTVASTTVNFVRINVTSITGGGLVYATWTGYINNPSGGGGSVTSVFGRNGVVLAVANDYTLDLIGSPAADKTFTFPISSVTGLTLTGTQPASSAGATGTNATNLLSITAVKGGNDSNNTGTAGVGTTTTWSIAGNGGDGTGTNTKGGQGGSSSITCGGNGGTSTGTSANADAGNCTVTPGTAGTGGSGAAGKNGLFQVAGANAAIAGFQQGPANTAANLLVTPNTAFYQAPVAVTSHFVSIPGAAPTNANSGWFCTGGTPSTCLWSKLPQTLITTGTAYSNASTTFSDVKGSTGQTLSFNAEASTNYTEVCQILWQGSAATTGPKFQFTGPASPTNVSASMMSPVTAVTFTQAPATNFSVSMANAGVITAATNFNATVTLGLVNGVNAGTVTLQAAANGAGTLTIQDGSFCVVQ